MYPSPTAIFHLFLKKIEVYLTYSSKMIGNFPEVLNFNQLFLVLNWFICNKRSVSPFIVRVIEDKEVFEVGWVNSITPQSLSTCSVKSKKQ